MTCRACSLPALAGVLLDGLRVPHCRRRRPQPLSGVPAPHGRILRSHGGLDPSVQLHPEAARGVHVRSRTLAAAAAREPMRYRVVAYLFATLFTIRALQRLVFGGDIHRRGSRFPSRATWATPCSSRARRDAARTSFLGAAQLLGGGPLTQAAFSGSSWACPPSSRSSTWPTGTQRGNTAVGGTDRLGDRGVSRRRSRRLRRLPGRRDAPRPGAIRRRGRRPRVVRRSARGARRFRASPWASSPRRVLLRVLHRCASGTTSHTDSSSSTTGALFSPRVPSPPESGHGDRPRNCLCVRSPSWQSSPRSLGTIATVYGALAACRPSAVGPSAAPIRRAGSGNGAGR